MEVNEKQIWEDVLELVGKDVSITFAKDGSKTIGTVTYASFDSLMLKSNGAMQCIAYKDILELLTHPG